MIVYNYNIDFVSEPVLNDTINNASLETIKFVQTNEFIDFNYLRFHSEYEEKGNRRQVRYSAEYEFIQCLENDCIWALEVQNVITFIWKIGSNLIRYKAGNHFSPKQLEFWSFHLLLPIKFTLEKKYTILHAAAVEVEGKCIIFSGKSFGGKSTIANYFMAQGHTLLCDDSLGIYRENNIYYAVSSFPYHRPYRKMEDLGYPANNISTKPIPIQAIYLLEKVDPDVPISITKVYGIEKFKALHFQSFINFKFLKYDKFNEQNNIAKTIPVYKVSIPWSLKKLKEVRQILLDVKY